MLILNESILKIIGKTLISKIQITVISRENNSNFRKELKLGTFTICRTDDN
jgi:hypothetical protein